MATVAGHNVGIHTIDEFKKQLRLTEEELGAIIGVNPSTLWRWRDRGGVPRGTVLSRLTQLEELLGLVRQVFDGPDLARDWLRRSRPESLGGQSSPLEIMMNGRIDRVLAVLTYLARGA